MHLGKLLAIGTALAAVLAVSTSLWLDSPTANRARAMDTERMRRLGLITAAINTYFVSHKTLPSDLEALDAEKTPLPYAKWRDPNTDQPIEYEIAGEKSYRLCANFERASDERTAYYSGKHGAGRDCFDYKVR
jgi:hypothetical protein